MMIVFERKKIVVAINRGDTRACKEQFIMKDINTGFITLFICLSLSLSLSLSVLIIASWW